MPKTAVNKKIVGLVEKVTVAGSRRAVETHALFDTGATRTSVDYSIAAKVGLGPVLSVVRVKSKTSKRGYVRRPVVRGKIRAKGRSINANINLEDRSRMKYPVLIGRDVIHKNFIIDVTLTHSTHKIADLKKSKKSKARKTKKRARKRR